jgi:hypothetical protein
VLEPLEGLPDGVIGFEAVGEVHADDYRDTMRPAVDATVQADGHLRLVYLLGDRFQSYSAGAGWQDARLGLAHLTAWKRLAIVSDVGWIHHVVDGFGWMVPGDIRHFAVRDLDDAVAWAAAGD